MEIALFNYPRRIEYILDYLEDNDNKLNTYKLIDTLFNDFYVAHKLWIKDVDYTLIIRHITSENLRYYFDMIVKKHNYELSLAKKKKIRYVDPKFVWEPFFLDREEQKLIGRDLNFVEKEFDDSGHILDTEEDDDYLPRIKVNSVSETQRLIQGHRGTRIYNKFACSLCSFTSSSGWKYKLRDNVVYLCNSCKAKVRDGNHFNVIYTPMKH